MGYITEPTVWADDIFRKETTTSVLGGVVGESNTQAKELAGRTQKIKSVLKKNAVFIDDAEFEYQGQNLIFTTDFFSSVDDGKFVYWKEADSKFYNAIAGGVGFAKQVVGVADKTNGKIIIDGVIPYANAFDTGTIIYLSDSLAGATTTANTEVPLGIIINRDLLRLTFHQFYKVDGTAITPSLRTLGTGSTQAAAGNDPRFSYIFPTGGIIMWSGLLVNIPSGWYLCDGNNGTPNLLDRFIRGVQTSLQNPGASGGTDGHFHTTPGHELVKAEIPTHVHTQVHRSGTDEVSSGTKNVADNAYWTVDTGDGSADGLGGGVPLAIGDAHYHGDTGNTSHVPKYFKLAYIMKG